MDTFEKIGNFLCVCILCMVLQRIYPMCDGLDIPLVELTAQSQIHCYELLICLQPLEYCSSIYRDCRPCTADICALRGSTTKIFPLQCSRNCSISDALLRESQKIAHSNLSDALGRESRSNCSDALVLGSHSNFSDALVRGSPSNFSDALVRGSSYSNLSDALVRESHSNFIQNHPMVWFILLVICLLVNLVTMFVSFFKLDRIKTCIGRTLRRFIGKSYSSKTGVLLPEETSFLKVQMDCPSSERNQCPKIINNHNPGSSPYCEDKLKGTCETKEDLNVTIATTKSKAPFVDNENIDLRLELPVAHAGKENPDLHPSASQEPPVHFFVESLDLTSNALRQAPSLNCDTFENNIIG